MSFKSSIVTLIVLFYTFQLILAVDVPYANCGKGSDHVTISSVTSNKWPPSKGDTLTLLFDGKTDEDITNGKYTVAVSYLGIPLPSTSGPLSDLLTLPVSTGPLVINSTSDFPSSSPSGSYAVQVSTVDQNGAQLFCTSVKFSLLERTAQQ